jgi:hypothetical protein
VVSFGHAPWMIVRSDLRLTLNNAKISKAHVLDPNGMPVREIILEGSKGKRSFEFPPDALYVVLQ